MVQVLKTHIVETNRFHLSVCSVRGLLGLFAHWVCHCIRLWRLSMFLWFPDVRAVIPETEILQVILNVLDWIAIVVSEVTASYGMSIHLSLFSVWSLVLDHAAYAQPSNLLSWGPRWCCWRREMPSQGTTFCTSGHLPSRTSGASVPKSSMENSVLVLLIISVCACDTCCFLVLC